MTARHGLGSLAAVSEPRPFRILFVTANRIGDAVLASGVLARLIDAHPGARVTVACGALPAPLFADLPGLERVHVMVKRPRGGHWLALWAAVAGHRWDIVVDLRGAVFAWTILAARRMVARTETRREHRVAELGRQLGLGEPPAPRLWVSPERDRRIVATLGTGAPILAVGPAANWGAKQWPAERFAETVRRLTASGGMLRDARVAVLAAANERATVAPVLDAVPPERRIDLVGHPDLLDLFAILGHCAFYIGNDSGLMHLAAAAGIPTLGLFGPSPEWRYGPWGAHTAVVRTPESFETLVSANPAFDHRRTETLMASLSVDAVVAAAEALRMRVSGGNAASP